MYTWKYKCSSMHYFKVKEVWEAVSYNNNSTTHQLELSIVLFSVLCAGPYANSMLFIVYESDLTESSHRSIRKKWFLNLVMRGIDGFITPARWQRLKKVMARMCNILTDVNCLPCSIYVLQRWELSPDDPLCAADNTLNRPPVLCSAA